MGLALTDWEEPNGDHGYVEDLSFPRCLRPGHLPDVLLTSRPCQTRFRVHVRTSHAHGLRGAKVTERHRQGVCADDGRRDGAAGDRGKQRYSTEARLQHGHVRDPPPGRLPQPVGGNRQQQLRSHQCWRQGLRQAKEKHPDVRAPHQPFGKRGGHLKRKKEKKKKQQPVNKNSTQQNYADKY